MKPPDKLRMSGEGVVTISADRLLEIADQLKRVESDLRKLGMNGFSTQPTKPKPQPQKPQADAMPLDFDILGLDWRRSTKAGGGDAGPNDKWAWTFAYPDAESHDPREDCYDLVIALNRFGSVQCGKYIVKLSGRENRLLARTFA